MIFGLDDKLIIYIKAIPGLPSSFSIALNSIWKQKLDKIDSNALFQNVKLLLKTFKKSTTILAKALVRTKSALFLFAKLVALVLIAASAESTSSLKTALNDLVATIKGLT